MTDEMRLSAVNPAPLSLKELSLRQLLAQVAAETNPLALTPLIEEVLLRLDKRGALLLLDTIPSRTTTTTTTTAI